MRSILFDVDGVLLDSYAGYREVWSAWCTSRGVDFDVAWAATHGRRPVETVAEVAAHLDPQVEYAVLNELLSSLGARFPAFPTAAEMVNELPPSRWAVVTSGERATVLSRFRGAGIQAPRSSSMGTTFLGVSLRRRGTCGQRNFCTRYPASAW